MSLIGRGSLCRAARSVAAATVLVALGAGAGASAADATEFSAGCSNLQTTIDAVALEANHGAGDVIVLSGLCDGSSLKSSSGVTLPAESNFSIEGAPGTTSGFDGAGVTGPLLGTGFEEVGTMTLSHLTFQHANYVGDGGALALRARTGLTLSADSFLENTTSGVVGGAVFVYVGNKQLACPPAAGPPGISLTGSTFRANKLIVGNGIGAGGAAWLLDECESARNVIEGNVFEGNTLQANESEQVLGGGLTFTGPGKAHPAPVSQAGNVFDSNSILAASGAGNYGGGGEWLEGASLTSVGDRFSRNSISGTSGPRWSWGGGLGILNTTCNSATPTESTLEDAVVAGNSIGAGTPADLGGAGVYVGCGPSLTNPNHLNLLDSTVTENATPPGGVAGIDGNPGDRLNIANSIVAGDSGGSETGGFNGAGGSLSATFSDVCAGGSAAPLPGSGNICANPALADNGSPSSFDVHETAASPTIDAGSNALLPAGLGTDFYGNTRVLSARYYLPACSPGASVGPTSSPPVVDMGASEFGPVAVPAYAILCPARILSSRFAAPGIAQRAGGQLLLAFKGLVAGRLSVLGTFQLTRTVLKVVKGRRRRVHKLETLTYGSASHSATAPGNVTLTLKPTKRALRILKARKRLRITLRSTFTATGASPFSQTRTIVVVYKAPRRARR